jgi:hypothetical protein
MNLIGPSYNLDDRSASVQRTINMMPVPVEPGNERAGWVFRDAPGLVSAVSEWDAGLAVSTALLTRRSPGGTQYGEISDEGRTFTYANVSSAWASAWVRRGVAGTGKRYFEVVNVGPQVTNFYAGFIAHSTWNAASGGYYPAQRLAQSVMPPITARLAEQQPDESQRCFHKCWNVHLERWGRVPDCG